MSTPSKPRRIEPSPVGDRVTIIRIGGFLYLVTCMAGGDVPLNSRVLARLEECSNDIAEAIADAINRGLEK